jgi:DNA-binding SARP family transcriptional activator
VQVGFGVLGPVAAWDAAGGPIALKGPRHRAVLARLIVARRRVVPVARLVEDLWEDAWEVAWQDQGQAAWQDRTGDQTGGPVGEAERAGGPRGRAGVPADPVGAVRTFVAALRRALEPDRPPRAPAALLVTEGPGYALRAAPDAVDAWRFEREVADAAAGPPARALARLDEALGRWRGPAYADFAGQAWARGERARLGELRLHAVERRAEALLALGDAARAVPDLDAHVAEHPWREDAWRLLALALYRTGRQGDALAVLRRARTLLVEQLGVDPGPALRRLEADVLAQARHLEGGGEPAGPGGPCGLGGSAGPGGPGDPSGGPGRPGGPGGRREPGSPRESGGPDEPRGPDEPAGPREPGGRSGEPRGRGDSVERVWAGAAAAYDRAVGAGARARLESTVGLLRDLAVTGGQGLRAARAHRVAAVAAAEELGDPELTARVIGAYDVPAIWTRVDDPEQAARVTAAAERALAALPPGAHPAARARLLATVALESRGTHSARGPQAARQAERLARDLDDPALLAFALNGVFMQTFDRTGLAPRRDAIGAELVDLAARSGLVTYEVLGRLVRLQARAGLADFRAADAHADAADRLAARHELPLVGVFTSWYRAMRLAETSAAAGPGPGSPAPDGPGRGAGGAGGTGSGSPAPDGPGPGSPAGPRPDTAAAEAAYRDAAALLDGAGMPGLERGLLPLALLCLRLRHAQLLRADADMDPDFAWITGAATAPRPDVAGGGDGPAGPEADADARTGARPDPYRSYGPYEPWARPFLLLARGRRAEAAAAVRELPDPPGDLMTEAMWCLALRAAVAVGDREAADRARTALAPAAGELGGGASGLVTLGPVAAHLEAGSRPGAAPAAGSGLGAAPAAGSGAPAPGGA